MRGLGKPAPRNDPEWARQTEQRLHAAETAGDAIRIGQWVIADRDGELSITSLDGRSFSLTKGLATVETLSNATPAADTKFKTVRRVYISGWVIGGTFTLTLDGATTDPIPYNASAAVVKAALAALPNYAASDFIVRGNDGGTWTIGFPGLALTGNGSGLDFTALFEGDVVVAA